MAETRPDEASIRALVGCGFLGGSHTVVQIEGNATRTIAAEGADGDA